MSLIAAIRNAVSGAAEDQPFDAAQPGASAPESPDGAEGVEMSTETKPAGGTNSGILQAEHDAAVSAAREQGRAEGAAAATDRLAAALGAEGVKGDAARMTAALDLAQKSPGMDGAAIAAFVATNVGAAASYEQQRLAAAGAAQPVTQKPQGREGAASQWEKALARVNGQG